MKKFKVVTAPKEMTLANIRVNEETHAIIKFLSKKNETTMAEVTRQMIEFAADNLDEEVLKEIAEFINQ